MYINFWYPAEWSKDLTDEPAKVRMLGQDFVLFRDSEGVAHCLSNTCIHRGGSLAGGKIVDDCIQCPYHGWQFDADGACRAMPSSIAPFFQQQMTDSTFLSSIEVGRMKLMKIHL